MTDTTITVPTDKLEAYGFESLVSRIAPAGVAYLLTYGLHKSLQDSAAGLVKSATAEHLEKNPGDDAGAAKFAEASVQDAMAKRFAKILSGEVGTGGGRGPALKGLDRFLFEVAEELLTARATAKGMRLPDKMTDRRPMIEAYRDGPNRDKIAKEANRRFKASQEVDDAADDILSGLTAKA